MSCLVVHLERVGRIQVVQVEQIHPLTVVTTTTSRQGGSALLSWIAGATAWGGDTAGSLGWPGGFRVPRPRCLQLEHPANGEQRDQLFTVIQKIIIPGTGQSPPATRRLVPVT